MMKKGNIFLIILIFCVIFSISSVVASDVNDTAIANEIDNTPEDTQPILQSDEDEIAPVKEPTQISVKTISGKEKTQAKIKATVKTSSNTPATGAKVTLKIDGKTYTAKTNSKGVATLKVKIPKTDVLKVNTKTNNNNIITKTTEYKKTYNCLASVVEDDNYESSSAKFKVISKKSKKTQKYKIVKKQVKTITIPYKQLGFRKKTSGHYVFGIIHEQLEENKISIIAGDKTLRKFIKFSSKVYYKDHGQKVYIPNDKWLKSKYNDSIHEYYYTGNAKMYITIKYNAYTYKKI